MHLICRLIIIKVVFGLWTVVLPAAQGAEEQKYPVLLGGRILGLSVAVVDLESVYKQTDPVEETQNRIRRLRELGFDCLMIKNAGSRASSTTVASSTTPLNTIVSSAEENGLTVLMKLTPSRGDWISCATDELANLAESTALEAKALLEACGDHDSLAGFVLPYELSDSNMEDPDYPERAVKFFASVSRSIKSIQSDLLVVGIGQLSLQGEIDAKKDFWRRSLHSSGLDILIGNLSLSENTNSGPYLWAAARGADESSVRFWAELDAANETDPTAWMKGLSHQVDLLQGYAERLVTDSEENFWQEGLASSYESYHALRKTRLSPLPPVKNAAYPNCPEKGIQGTFLNFSGLEERLADPAFLKTEFDRMQAMGIQYIIPESARERRSFYPSEHNPPDQPERDLLGPIFDEAERRGMKVIVSLPSYEHSWVWTVDADITVFMEKVIGTIRELHSLYKDKPAFYGWYIPYELCDAFLSIDSHRQFVANAFKQMTDLCHTLDPEKPTLISPYFTTNLPDETFTAIWVEIIRSSGVDIVAMQDSVGALNVTGNGSETLRLSNLPHYVDLIADICEKNGTRFWWNVESFRQTTGHPLIPGRWSAVTTDLPRLQKQIAASSRRAEVLINFDYPHYFSPGQPRADLAARNKALYEEYVGWGEKCGF